MSRSKAGARLAATVAAIQALACGFPPLVRVTAADPELAGDSGEGVAIDGIRVSPAVIHPGDRVTLRDPTPTDPGQPAPLYYWDACDGALEGGTATYGPQAVWTAPPAPGLYAVSLNVANAPRERPSRVFPLCVVAGGESTCPASGGAVTLAALQATPDSFRQGPDCGGSCASDVKAEVVAPGGTPVRFRWAVRRGEVVGEAMAVRWQLPTVGCCTETFTIAFTACAPDGAAATGFTHVVVFPE